MFGFSQNVNMWMTMDSNHTWLISHICKGTFDEMINHLIKAFSAVIYLFLSFKSIVKNYFLHVTVILTSVLCLGWNVKISYFKACASLLMIPLFIAYSRPWLFSKNLSDMILFWIRSSSVCHFVVFCIFLYKLFKLLFIHTL